MTATRTRCFRTVVRNVKGAAKLARENLRMAKRLWPGLGPLSLQRLREYSQQFRFSVAAGDLIFLDRGWYVTHSGLMRVADFNRCAGIHVQPVPEFSNAALCQWVFKATVYKSAGCQGFVGYGDANSSNISPLVRGAEMRMAETRAVSRALRKAYGIGICSVEEIGSFDSQQTVQHPVRKLPPESPNNGKRHDRNGNGSRVRDRLCQLIRQHNLDAELVKAYAVDFCGAQTLRDASREQVENFVAHLADWATKDRSALLCQLNSYLRHREGAA
jgi:hypothetical protein